MNDKKYDIIVVGSGLGGLSAAAYCAKQGRSVLVCEKSHHPGGYATCFSKKQYRFDASLHLLSGIGTKENPGTLGSYLDYLGVREAIDFEIMSDLYRTRSDTFDITLPWQTDSFVEALSRIFPRYSRGIKQLTDTVLAIAAENDEFVSDLLSTPSLSPFVVFKLGLKMKVTRHYLFSTVHSVVSRFIDDSQVREILTTIWPYLGLPPGRLSFCYFALALGAFLKHGPAYPRGGSGAIVASLVQRLSELGGESRYECGIKEIVVKDKVTKGVVTFSDEFIPCTAVIWNAGPVESTNALAVKKYPFPHTGKIFGRNIGTSIFCVYLGCNKSPQELGISSHTIFLSDHGSGEEYYSNSYSKIPPRLLIIRTYDSLYSGLSPVGKTVITLSFLSQGNIWLDLPRSIYDEQKHLLAESAVEKTAKIIPGLKQSIDVMLIATPRTFFEYSGNPSGSIFGYANTSTGHTFFRPPVMGTVQGFYRAGAWTQPGGGFSPVIFSGQIAGSLACSDASGVNRMRRFSSSIPK